MTKRPDFSAQYLDQWYANMAGAGPVDEITQRRLGLPASLLSTSLLTRDGIADVVQALRLLANRTLLDMACGRGGYGLEIAARTGARLIGVDYSAEAIRQATDNARAAGAGRRAVPERRDPQACCLHPPHPRTKQQTNKPHLFNTARV